MWYLVFGTAGDPNKVMLSMQRPVETYEAACVMADEHNMFIELNAYFPVHADELRERFGINLTVQP